MAATPQAWGGRPSRGRLPRQRESKLRWVGRVAPRPAPHWAPWTTQRIGGGARAGSAPRSRRGGPCRGRGPDLPGLGSAGGAWLSPRGLPPRRFCGSIARGVDCDVLAPRGGFGASGTGKMARPIPTRATGRGRRGRLHAACLRGRLAKLQSARQGGTVRSPSRAWAPAYQALATRAPWTLARYRRNGRSPVDSHRVPRRANSQHTHPSHWVRTLGAGAGRPRAGQSRSSPAGGWSTRAA